MSQGRSTTSPSPSPSPLPSPSPSVSDFPLATCSSLTPSVQQSNDVGNTSIEDTRNFICACGDSFSDPVNVVRILKKIVNNHWRGVSINYTNTPNETKELWWKEFKRFYWNESEENEMKKIFKKKVGDHI